MISTRETKYSVVDVKTYQLMVPFWPEVAKNQVDDKSIERICSRLRDVAHSQKVLFPLPFSAQKSASFSTQNLYFT